MQIEVKWKLLSRLDLPCHERVFSPILRNFRSMNMNAVWGGPWVFARILLFIKLGMIEALLCHGAWCLMHANQYPWYIIYIACIPLCDENRWIMKVHLAWLKTKNWSYLKQKIKSNEDNLNLAFFSTCKSIQRSTHRTLAWRGYYTQYKHGHAKTLWMRLW